MESQQHDQSPRRSQLDQAPSGLLSLPRQRFDKGNDESKGSDYDDAITYFDETETKMLIWMGYDGNGVHFVLYSFAFAEYAVGVEIYQDDVVG